MSTRQMISGADYNFVGRGYNPGAFGVNQRRGAPVNLLTKADLGAPAAASAKMFLNDCTSTNNPNIATKTYTAATSGVAPLNAVDIPTPASVTMYDGQSYLVWTQDVPRNLALVVTHSSAIIAVSVTITGYDTYRNPITETLSVTANGTSKTATGKKAFKYIYSIAITSAGNATTDTIDLGTGALIGVPYQLTSKTDILKCYFDATAASSPAYVIADTTNPATATTGDVRGTVTSSDSFDGTSHFFLWYWVEDPNSSQGIVGVDPYTFTTTPPFNPNSKGY